MRLIEPSNYSTIDNKEEIDMEELKRINSGDKVSVHFNGAQITLCFEAIVRSMPCATGDSWIFEDCRSGEVHYVSEGCTITKKPD